MICLRVKFFTLFKISYLFSVKGDFANDKKQTGYT